MSSPGLDPGQVRELVIRPALARLGMLSRAAEDLVLGTAVAESLLRFLKQYPSGPALGIFQMEPATHDDIWESWLRYRPQISKKLGGTPSDPGRLVWDLQYAAMMCRIHYARRREPLPEIGDIEGYGRYWKKHYNTSAGRGTPEGFVKKFEFYLSEPEEYHGL